MKMRAALAIAGLDPGGGAGIAADLRAFGAAGAYGCAIAAVLTVQSTGGLVASRAVGADFLRRQLDDLVEHQRLAAVKTGALGTAANVRAVARWLTLHPALPAVVDPVLAPTAGTGRLIAASALGAVRDELVPRATLVTANASEASELTGMPVRTVIDATRAARALVSLGARAALVKGGHLAERDAVDILALRGGRVVVLNSRRLVLPKLHGGGCVLASLVAGRLAVDRGRASDEKTHRAVRWARAIHQRSLRAARDVGGPSRVLVPIR